MTVDANDERETALVVPHIPTDVVGLKGVAHVVEPSGAHGGIGEVLKDTKLAAVNGDIVFFAPGSDGGALVGHALGVPVLLAVIGEELLGLGVGLVGDQGRERLR